MRRATLDRSLVNLSARWF